MSESLHFAEHTLQEAALAFMGLVYLARLLWLFRRFRAGRDRQPPTGRPGTGATRGILYSWANIAMPWAMESTRNRPFLYAQFVLFHLGVTASIALSFVIPYGPALLARHPGLVLGFQGAIGIAFLVGVLRMIRRLRDPYLRAISTPDDYFSLALLTVWFAFAFFSAPNERVPEWILLAYFYLTAFFLVYVPFSKISHYLYYPITRYYLGRTLGHRGSYPLVRSKPGWAQVPSNS